MNIFNLLLRLRKSVKYVWTWLSSYCWAYAWYYLITVAFNNLSLSLSLLLVCLWSSASSSFSLFASNASEYQIEPLIASFHFHWNVVLFKMQSPFVQYIQSWSLVHFTHCIIWRSHIIGMECIFNGSYSHLFRTKTHISLHRKKRKISVMKTFAFYHIKYLTNFRWSFFQWFGMFELVIVLISLLCYANIHKWSFIMPICFHKFGLMFVCLFNLLFILLHFPFDHWNFDRMNEWTHQSWMPKSTHQAIERFYLV